MKRGWRSQPSSNRREGFRPDFPGLMAGACTLAPRPLADPMLETHEVETGGRVHSSVIWMHGLGASCHDFDDLVPLLATQGVRFVFPQAPQRPVTINGGMRMPAWYDILSLQDPPLREAPHDVEASLASIQELIAREQERGVPSQRVVVAGFSQGGAMALHALLHHDAPLRGAMVLSAYLLRPDRFEARHTANAKNSVLFCHGTQDEVVPLELGKSAFSRLQGEGYDVSWNEFSVAHGLCMPEVKVIAQWLGTAFASVDQPQ